MITPDDPRHGTERGYRAGCHERCCLDGAALYERRRSKLKALGRDGRLDPTGTQRRVRALQALGWTLAHISAAGGFSCPEALGKVVSPGTKWVFPSTVVKTHRAYAALSMRPGPSRVTAARAARAGWPPPLAWDDDTIDDPRALPQHQAEPVDTNGKPIRLHAKRTVHIDEVEFLTEQGASRTTIIEQLHIHPTTLQTALKRAARLDLWTRLCLRDQVVVEDRSAA